MDQSDTLLDAAQAQIDALLALEPRLALAANKGPDYPLQETLTQTLIGLRNLALQIAHARSPATAPGLQLEACRGNPSIRVLLDGTCIGWIHAGSEVRNVGMNEVSRIGYTVYRPNKWMLKRPSYKSIEAALERLLDEWNARPDDSADATTSGRDGDVPPKRLWDAARLAEAGISRAETALALTAWIGLVRVTAERAPTLHDAAGAFGLDPETVRECLAQPNHRLEPSRWNPNDAAILPR